MSPESSDGNISIRLWVRYTVVPRSWASPSSGVSCATKAHTSAILTATSIQPSFTKVTLMASSISCGVGNRGSMMREWVGRWVDRGVDGWFDLEGGLLECVDMLYCQDGLIR